jgi:hypothetical protein
LLEKKIKKISIIKKQEDFLFEILYSVSLIKKFVEYNKRRYPTEFADSTQKHHTIIETPNLTIRMKVFPNESMFSTLKV